MTETTEFRILNEYSHLLPNSLKRKENGMNVIVNIRRDDPNFERIAEINRHVREKFNDYFFIYHKVIRKYSKRELDNAKIFQIKIKNTFEPAGEECGTHYDYSESCMICGANRIQLGSLKLRLNSIPKKDISRTISGEIVVSNKFTNAFKSRNLSGIKFAKVYNYNDQPIDFFQVIADSPKLTVTKETNIGIDPFDLSESSLDETYKCPMGHTLGLNLLSELYLESNVDIYNYDFFVSKELVGVKRGLLRPVPLLICSQSLRRMIDEETLTGFSFEVAYIKTL